MTMREWEKRLQRSLGRLPKEEKNKILEYYREIYGDRLESGADNDAILSEFGIPEICAARILSEEYTDQAFYPSTSPQPVSSAGKTALYITGMSFLTLLLILPLTCAALGVVVSFGAVSISGAVVALGGFVLTLCAFAPTGLPLWACIGTGLAMIGVGCLLFVGFWLLTKYTAIGCVKLLKLIYVRKKEA